MDNKEKYTVTLKLFFIFFSKKLSLIKLIMIDNKIKNNFVPSV